jgi:hypothetical protein
MSPVAVTRGKARKKDRRTRPERKKPGREPELQGDAMGTNPGALRARLRKAMALAAAPGTEGERAAAQPPAKRLKACLERLSSSGRGRAWRKCLWCNRWFESEWIGNKRCGKCQKRRHPPGPMHNPGNPALDPFGRYSGK